MSFSKAMGKKAKCLETSWVLFRGGGNICQSPPTPKQLKMEKLPRVNLVGALGFIGQNVIGKNEFRGNFADNPNH